MSDLTPHDRPTGEVVRGKQPNIPIGFRPAPSDEQLETNVLERWQGFGVLLALFLALFLPAYMIYFEPNRMHDAALEQREETIKRGAHIYAIAEEGAHGFQAGCARCHGALGEGGVVPQYKASATAPPVDYPAPALNTVFKRQIVDQKKTPKEAYQFVYEVISKGRPGTPMPTWGLGYGGPMNDQQIEDVVNFLVSIQTGLPDDVASQLAVGRQPGQFSRLIAFAAAER